MLIAQGYNRIATIYPIPKYMTGKYRKEYDCYKVQIDYEAIRLGRNLKKAILICNNHELKQVMITSINQVYKIFVHSYDINMKHAALFNGIGGFQLAAEWMGWDNIMSCEIDEWCNKVTKYHFPNCIQHGDIKTTDFTIYRGGIDIITGGFPCQPYSAAGKRKGKEDERHLWPEMLRAIREIRPRWVVGENVRGLTNWNGGMVFDEVCADLEAEGYEVIPVILPAASVNAPHRRDRVWFIAYTNSGKRCEGRVYKKGCEKTERHTCTCNTRYGRTDWQDFPTQSPVCSGDDGIPGRLDGITFSKWRNNSIKGYGNAIVPQVAYQIFKAIEAWEKLKPTK